MANTHSQAESTQDRLIGGVHNIARKAEHVIETGADKMEGAINTASEKMSGAQATAQDYSEEILAQAQDAYDRVLSEGKKRADKLEKDIQKAPFTSVGIAFLGGVVLAALIKR